MDPTPQAGYTCSQAATMVMKRLKHSIKKGTPGYKGAHDNYLKSFYYYRNKHSGLQVGKKEIPNSFVGSMIAFWESCAEGERPILTTETIEEIMEDSSAYIKKTKKTYSQIRASKLLYVDRQTIIHWLNDEKLSHIIISSVRKPLKSQVDEMRRFYIKKYPKRKKRKKYDSAVYKEYFIGGGLLQPKIIKQKGKKPMTYDSLAAKCSGLQAKKGELEKRVKTAESALKASEKERVKLAVELAAMKKEYQTATTENKAANKRIGKLETQVERLQERYDGIEAGEGNLSELLTTANRQLTAANKKVISLTTKNETLAKQRDSAKQQNKEYKTQIEDYKKAAKSKKKKYTPKESPEYKSLERQKKALYAQVKTLTKQSKVTNKKIGTLETKVTGLEEKVDIITEERDDLNSQIATYGAETEEPKGDTEPPETPDYALVVQENKDLAAQVKELEKANRGLTTKNKLLQKQAQSPKRGKQEIRVYCVDETYEEGEMVKHPIWGVEGPVISASGPYVKIDFKKLGIKTLTQGKKLEEL